MFSNLEIPAEVSGIAIDPMTSPTGFEGSLALMDKPSSYVVLDASKTKSGIEPHKWEGITVTAWIKPKGNGQIQTLMVFEPDFKNISDYIPPDQLAINIDPSGRINVEMWQNNTAPQAKRFRSLGELNHQT